VKKTKLPAPKANYTTGTVTSTVRQGRTPAPPHTFIRDEQTYHLVGTAKIHPLSHNDYLQGREAWDMAFDEVFDMPDHENSHWRCVPITLKIRKEVES
jgi:hypothetical protein